MRNIGSENVNIGWDDIEMPSSHSIMLYQTTHSAKVAASTLKLGQTYMKLGRSRTARLMLRLSWTNTRDSSETEVARKAIEATATTEDPTNLSP